MCKAALDILESVNAVPWFNGSAAKWLCRHKKVYAKLLVKFLVEIFPIIACSSRLRA